MRIRSATPANPRRRALVSATAVLAVVAAPAATELVTPASAAAAESSASLHAGEVLHDGQSLVDGSLTFAMQADGNFVLYAGSQPLWQSGTAGRGGTLVAMQTDGNLVVYDSASRPLWWSGTGGHSGARLELQGDANGVIYDAGNRPLWQTGTSGRGKITPPPQPAGSATLRPGQVLHAGHTLVNSGLTFAVQADGNLVLYSGSRSLWQSATAGRSDTVLAMQADGNLVLYDASSRPVWWSGTAGHPGAHLELQSDANVVVYSSDGRPIWQTGTAGQGQAAPQPGGTDSTRRTAALSWERSQAGSTGFDGQCERAVEYAYGRTFRYGSAHLDYLDQLQRGRIHADRHAPAGALVFFRGSHPGDGHVGIAVGDDQTYWTTDGTIHVAPYSEGMGYLGWSYAPGA